MIRGEKFFFFQMIPCRKGAKTEYRIAKSYEDLYLRFGSAYMSKFHSITKLDEFTLEHIVAINHFFCSKFLESKLSRDNKFVIKRQYVK